MLQAVYVLALRVIFSLVVLIHLLVIVNYTKLDCAPYMIPAPALAHITFEKATRLPTVVALTRVLAFGRLLELACDDFFGLIDEPDAHEPIDAADMGPYLPSIVLHLLQGTLYTGAKLAANRVNSALLVFDVNTASGTVPFFLFQCVEAFLNQLTSIAGLMDTHLAKTTDKYLIFLKIVEIEAHVTGYLILIVVLLDDD